jgi:DNA ligase-1
MEYGALVDVYEALVATEATLEKTAVLADALADAGEDLPAVVHLARGKAFADWRSADLGVSSALASEAVAKATGVDGDTLEDWWREAGDLGDAAARAAEDGGQQTLFSQALTVERVHETLRELPDYEGAGSRDRKVDAVAGLVADADPREAKWVVRTVVGAMRLGVGEGILRDAVAAAFLDGRVARAVDAEAAPEPVAGGGPDPDVDGPEDAVAAVERALRVTNDVALVAERAREGGAAALSALSVEVFRPVKPMLADAGESLDDALADLAAVPPGRDAGDGGPPSTPPTDDDTADPDAVLEVKYDGIRVKLHREDGTVRLFTRRLEEVTEQFPEVVDAAERALDADSAIAEAELVAYDPETGDPLPFQELSRRVRREEDVRAVAEEVPVTAHCFDLLYRDGESLLDAPLAERLDALDAVLDPVAGGVERADNRRTGDVAAAESFYEDALGAGHEGLMVKNPAATYRPGSRVGYQQKVKPTMEPLDLVVTRALWSEGRKGDYLGRPFFACRDAETGDLLEVGRLHTGFTDEQLERFHGMVEPLVRSVDGREADLDPEVVIEVEYEEIQESPTYDSGFALRFPRLKAIRDDLDPADADTHERVRTLFEQQR